MTVLGGLKEMRQKLSEVREAIVQDGIKRIGGVIQSVKMMESLRKEAEDGRLRDSGHIDDNDIRSGWDEDKS